MGYWEGDIFLNRFRNLTALCNLNALLILTLFLTLYIPGKTLRLASKIGWSDSSPSYDIAHE